jgi:hypothetical protein
VSDDRDGYECDGDCGCGVCVPKGETPDPSNHVLWGGVVCGKYVLTGPCEACAREADEPITVGPK